MHTQNPGRSRGAGTTHPRDQLVDEPLRAALALRRSLPQAHVQHLARCRPGSPASGGSRAARVPVSRRPACRSPAPRRRTSRGRSPAAPRPGPRPPPRAADDSAEHPVELAHMPERERAQERPQRRGRHHPMLQHTPRAARSAAHRVVDRVGADQHRVDRASTPSGRPGRARPPAEIDRLIDHLLDPEPAAKRRRQHEPGVRDRTLVVERDPQPVHTRPPPSPRLLPVVTIRMTSRAQNPRLPTQPALPAQEVIFRSRPDNARPAKRWIEAQFFRRDPVPALTSAGRAELVSERAAG